ncbi:MAG: hypothetical protein MPJ22_09775 [Pirellulales bacterium]|nr:hypothetical protein [Pirellulales bacterium]MDA8042692.1 hypothetical protein [Pirellulales bacterium]
MNRKERIEKLILSSERAIVELEKIIEQVIDLEKLDPERAATAAKAKWIAIEDTIKIIDKIEDLKKQIEDGDKDKVETESGEEVFVLKGQERS